MRNPLIPSILALLQTYPEGISEFDLLKHLKQEHSVLTKLAEDTNLLLFRQHFLIMNALYQLQSSLWQEDSLTLSICATHIKILHGDEETEPSNSTTISDSVDAKLASYYLDWDEYVNTDEEEVERLLDGFYNGVFNINARKQALRTLGLDEGALEDKDVIKRQYRKLAHDAHPDRGGDTEHFISLRQAYECLIH